MHPGNHPVPVPEGLCLGGWQQPWCWRLRAVSLREPCSHLLVWGQKSSEDAENKDQNILLSLLIKECQPLCPLRQGKMYCVVMAFSAIPPVIYLQRLNWKSTDFLFEFLLPASTCSTVVLGLQIQHRHMASLDQLIVNLPDRCTDLPLVFVPWVK